MKRLVSNNIFYKCAVVAGVAAMSVMPLACDNHAKADGNSSYEFEAERPDSSLNFLMRALAEEDASGFAAVCAYPIQRIYPLRCIEDSATMVDYFPVLVDDSLKSIAKKSSVKDWNYHGWRGWALGDSAIMWYDDDGLQFVDYESKAETGLRKMLARNEIMTLSPELREGWTPIETLVEIDGDRIFRIDAADDTFRLMEYENESTLRDKPTLILLGTMSMEGSGDYRIFAFADSLGTKAEYLPDGEPPVKIDITGPDHEIKSHKVRRGYWRDHIN